MENKRKTPQYSIPLYPELKNLVDEVIKLTGKPKARVLYDACVRGLRSTLEEQKQVGEKQ